MSSSGRTSIRDSHYPSFSSTLLEEIYRSLDEERENQNHHRMMITKSTTIKKSSSCYLDRDRERFVAVDQWIENDQKINLRRKSTPRRINHSSSTSSSDSSSGIGGFSSSDTESMYGSAKSKQKLPPIRTAARIPAELSRKSYCIEIPAKKKKIKEGNLQRRALKLYSELKKVKQPISPGGKLTSLLNSLFHSGRRGDSKKSTSGVKVERESPATTTTTSRSCLSKTPSSAGRTHRSVRFVDDEDHRKYDVAKRDSSNDEEFKLQTKEKQRRVEEVAKELLKNYHHHNRKELKVNIVADGRQFDPRNNVVNNIRNFEDDEEDEDDDVSCGSSDLFELENLLEIGMADRYSEELPVYETTHADTNRAIANGFVLY